MPRRLEVKPRTVRLLNQYIQSKLGPNTPRWYIIAKDKQLWEELNKDYVNGKKTLEVGG